MQRRTNYAHLVVINRNILHCENIAIDDKFMSCLAAIKNIPCLIFDSVSYHRMWPEEKQVMDTHITPQLHLPPVFFLSSIWYKYNEQLNSETSGWYVPFHWEMITSSVANVEYFFAFPEQDHKQYLICHVAYTVPPTRRGHFKEAVTNYNVKCCKYQKYFKGVNISAICAVRTDYFASKQACILNLYQSSSTSSYFQEISLFNLRS